MRKIILASGSPRRKKILKDAGIRFRVINTNLNENLLIKKLKVLDSKKLVKILSLLKCMGACHHMYLHGDEIITGFDTMVVCKNKIIGKPKNKKDALNKLLFLSKKKHLVITGMCIIDLKNKLVILDSCTTQVHMNNISKKEALEYIETKEPLDKAGAYAIQGKGKKFIKRIDGDYFNVVGLPVNQFIRIISKLNHSTT